MKKVLLIILVLTIVVGCSTKTNETKEEKQTSDIDYKEVLKDDNYLIIDVRTKEEYNESHIKGAINIPYDEINEYSDIPMDKAILVYCKSGTRSAKAYETLTNLNYNVFDLGAFDNIDLEKE